jgi:hypothetical protein
MSDESARTGAPSTSPQRHRTRLAYSAVSALETSGRDPWSVCELPCGLWRVRAALCRALEGAERVSS